MRAKKKCCDCGEFSIWTCIPTDWTCAKIRCLDCDDKFQKSQPKKKCVDCGGLVGYPDFITTDSTFTKFRCLTCYYKGFEFKRED